MSAKMKKCKVCNTEIASNAKVCPNCGAKNKKPIYKKPWIYILAVVVVVIAIAASGGEKPVEIDYSKPEIVLSADDILSDYTANSVTADEKYNGKVIEVSGEVGSISEGYFRIDGVEDENWLNDVVVYYTADQLEVVKQLKKENKVTVVGLCDSTDAFSDVKIKEAKIVAEKSVLTENVATTAADGAEATADAQPETIEVFIDTLLEDYENNSVAADEKYKGKNLVVTGGKVMSIDEDCIRIDGPDGLVWSYVNAYYASTDQIKSLNTGDKIKVSGICKGEEIIGIKLSDAKFE